MTSTLILVADPMCSWCYGFAPQFQELRARHPELDATVLMGGLRAFATEPLPTERVAAIRGHHARITELSGLPFSPRSPLDEPGWIPDSEPACRAVVTVRAHDPVLAMAYLDGVMSAFHAEGRDITQGPVLAEVASRFGIHRDPFLDQWDSAELRQWVQEDFAQASHWGIQAFPALVLDHQESLTLIAQGWLPADVLAERVESVLDAPHPGLPQARAH